MSSFLKAEEGILALKIALSPTTSAEEYPTLFLHNVGTLDVHYTRPYLRKWRRYCVRQRALTNISNELLSRRENEFTTIIMNDLRLKIEAKKRR